MRKILKMNMIERVPEYPFAHIELLGFNYQTSKITLPTRFCILPSCCRSPRAITVTSIEFSRIPQLDMDGPDKLNAIEGRVRSHTGVKVVRHGWKDKEGVSKHDYLSTRA